MSKTTTTFQQVSVACRDLSYSLKSGKTLLRHVNLLAEPGELLVVVGPSGAGKTTLLNNIAFRTKGGTQDGQIFFNGLPANAKTFRGVCNYVTTDGRMLPYLTVRETLATAAQLKLPHLSREERMICVDSVMSDLGLTHCQDTYIGGEWKKGISTGERKRVCIAIELLDEPSVLILDEPTSGLDSTLACELLTLLQRLTLSGRTVICSFHQPTSQMWSLFDHILFLAKGSVVYHGKAADAKRYFARIGFECPKNYNPADFFLSLMSHDEEEFPRGSCGHSTAEAPSSDSSDLNMIVDMNEGFILPSSRHPSVDLKKLVQSFEKSSEGETLNKRIDVIQNSSVEKTYVVKLDPKRDAAKTWCRAVRALYWRSFKNSIRNPIVCCVMLLVQALQGIILGGIFWQLSSDVKGQAPYRLDTKALVENPWSQLFINGVDGRQPLLDALENGVDGKGSQPLLNLINDPEKIRWLRETVTCAVGKMMLGSPDRDYPSFGVRQDGGSIPLANETYLPKETVGNILGLLQQGDYQYMHRDKTSIKESMKEHEGESSLYWLEISKWIAPDLLNPFMTCSGFPPYPDTAERDKTTKKTESAPHRELITIGDTGIEDAMYDLFGIGSRELVDTTKVIVDRLRKCDHKICERINGVYTDSVQLGEDAFTATMSVVNILGALFFMVANLGFASYDALLTFPQERSLFNRESANGLYRPSCYFLAKNLADLPFQLIPSFVLITIYYFFVGLGGTVAQYFIYVLICTGMTFAAYGFGYLVSAASPRMEIAVLIAPVVLVIWLTIAGFFLRDEQIPKWIGWFSYFSFYKWGFFSLVINQFPSDQYFGLMINRIPLVMAGITDTRLWFTMILLYVLGFVYRFCGYFALKYTNRSVGLS